MAVTPQPSGSSHAGLSAGHVLAGRYRLDGVLASGGMAQVWRGTDEILRRAIAVKILHPHLTADETFVARFRQEAIAVAKLSHPAIVSVYDTCSDNGVEAIVMELVTGNTLRQQLDAGPMDPWLAASIATQVAGALETAHAQGLVHRDIKPANILMSDDGRVKVGDFGIAKAAESSTDLTQEGSFVGTAKYLAPEQVEGKRVDARTDLYSLGVVLYEMLAGRPPFEADGTSATALARLHSDPRPLHQVRPGLPRELEQLTLRLLSRQPAGRYQNAHQARLALIETGADPSGHTSENFIGLPTGAQPAATGRTDAIGGDGRGPAPGPHAAPPGYHPAPPTDHTEVRSGEDTRNWLIPALLILLTTVSLGIAGLLLGQSGGLSGDEGGDDDDVTTDEEGEAEDDTSGEPTAIDLPGAPFTSFDPEGDGSEQDDDLPNLVDGDPSTTWNTDYYNSRAFGNLKEGVGYYVELPESTDVRGVELESHSTDWSVQIHVADEAGGSIGDWGEPVASQDGISTGPFALELDEPVSGQYLLVYITHLGTETDDAGRSYVEVSELTVLE